MLEEVGDLCRVPAYFENPADTVRPVSNTVLKSCQTQFII